MRVRELLAQAVQCLGDSGGTSSQPQASQLPASQPHSSSDSCGTHTNLGPSSTSSRSMMLLSCRPSVLAERNFPFNYGGKRNVAKVSGNRKSKKKRLAMWTHDFVGLVKKTLTPVERSKLISAGTMSLHLSCLAFFSCSNLLYTFRILTDVPSVIRDWSPWESCINLYITSTST